MRLPCHSGKMLAEAETLLKSGEKIRAHEILREIQRIHPQSPAAEEARKMMMEIK